MSVYRGHRHPPGVSERTWAQLKRAAKAAKLHEDTGGQSKMEDVLESLLRKGYKPAWILDKLSLKKDSRDTFRGFIARQLRRQNNPAGWEPGRTRYYKRPKRADIELFYYH